MQEIVLISIPESSIRNIVEQAVRKVVAEALNVPADNSDGQLITRQQAADLAGVCLATIDNKANKGVLQKYHTGGIVRFKKQEVVDAFSKSMFPKKAHAAKAKGKNS